MDSTYMVVRSDRASLTDLVTFVVYGRNAQKVLDAGPLPLEGSEISRDHRWIIVVSIILRCIICFLRKPMELWGLVVEFSLNFCSLNGGRFIQIITNILTGRIMLPKRGSESYFSITGYIDTRLDLDLWKFHTESTLEIEGRALMDLCIMASKLVYENANVVNNVVTNHWKMHFVDFYNCWNEYQKERSTQVFILCDKSVDADIILISFRGTEPFDSDDWCTDLDYSWYEIPEMGKIHMGFLEALGFGSRDQISSFQSLLQDPTLNSYNLLAYSTVENKLKTLLKTHKNAKFVITGHSLGGALAILFPAILLFHEETELLERLLAVYTFGQPRVGDEKLERFMESHLSSPVQRYFRVVYCNDLVPRLPCDDKLFLFKHFGICFYYNCFYVKKNVREEPNKNFFGIWYMITAYLIAIWELIRGIIMGYIYGNEYKETWLSIYFRVSGLIMPGISAHSPVNYVNCVRLGR